jgi:diaminopimelate decarboxylase
MHLAAYQRAFAGRNAKVHYAMKANSSLGVLQVFAQAGCGFDIVSAGELERVLAAGGHAADVIFSGVGKTREEMRVACKQALLALTSRAKRNSMCSTKWLCLWAKWLL